MQRRLDNGDRREKPVSLGMSIDAEVKTEPDLARRKASGQGSLAGSEQVHALVDSDPLTDPSNLEGAKLKDRDALRKLAIAGYRFALAMTTKEFGRGSDAEDCAIRSTTISIENVERVESPNTFRDYLRGVTKMIILDMADKRDRRSLRETSHFDDAAITNPTSFSSILGDGILFSRFDLARAFRKLKPGDRQLLFLFCVQGLTNEEIAQILGANANAVRAHLNRARRRLRALLAGASDSAE